MSDVRVKIRNGVATFTDFIGSHNHSWVCVFGGGFKRESVSKKMIKGKPTWENHVCRVCKVRKFIKRTYV